MSTLYALMVGIDDYLGPQVRPLSGCRNDIDDATRFLSARCATGTELKVESLFDHDATGVAIVEGFRTHLAKAGPGDTALFWFCGHGSRAPVPKDLWHLEDNGAYMHTLVCSDSRHDGRPDLLDKELALLVDDVAAGGGHVVTILDSCYSGGAARGPEVRVRAERPRSDVADVSLVPDLSKRYATGPPPVRHVQLAACQPTEVAGEQRLDGRQRGLFSWALLQAMRRAGPGTTYRELLVLARNEVERLSYSQRPHLFPSGSGLADRPLLGGDTITQPPSITMRHGRHGWEIDAGSCHGMVAGTADEPYRVAVADRAPAREAQVTRVEVRRSMVEPIGWRPDPHQVYPVVVSAVPMPLTTVAVDAEEHPEFAAQVGRVLQHCGPNGGPSPHVRRIGGADSELTLCASAGGRIAITDRDRYVLRDGLAPADARRIVAELEHIARWRQVRNLRNPASRLHNAVSLEIVEPLPGERNAPRDRAAVRPDDDGAFRLAYHLQDGEWTPPERFVRLRNNTANRSLYCVLLDLTDDFCIDADLFRGAEVAAGAVAPVAQGERVEFSLLSGRRVEPGAQGRDWLMMIVAEDEIAASPFEMPPISEAGHDTANRGPLGLEGLVERLGRRAVDRDVRPIVRAGVCDWWTLVVPVITEVPARRTDPFHE
ncbi:caspase family protein [Dactylosporangium sp. CA-139066]|uniref:caspase family protein n=1 Tax=Dactylosporangium sp. CA-139066 TaxID=3239930 RepID=UPI003D93064C